ncbi:MAG: MarC family NAAT transporter [Saprospiraceae bacterium]|nr:MarC family NAAT transporter [Saprospiraceae bacterium]
MNDIIGLFVAVLASLFSVVNPIGAVPVFLSMTANYTKAARNKTVLYTSIYFTAILLVFFFAGTLILSFFGISINAMRIAGGLVILSSGYGLLSSKFEDTRAISPEVTEEALHKQDISFSPLAMPLLSGPGSISLLISLSAERSQWLDKLVIAFVIVTIGLIVFMILRSAPYFNRVLGVAGMRALSRIMGFIVMAIAVQYIISGVVDLVKSLV